MTTLEKGQLVVGSAIVAIAYMAPTLLSAARLRSDIARILVLNACLGWTVVGWLYALKLACRPTTPPEPTAEWSAWRAGRPEAAGSSTAAASTYVDGSFLISECDGARTWAVCVDGRWGIAFELDGIERTAAWVDSSDVPVEILAHALVRREERKP